MRDSGNADCRQCESCGADDCSYVEHPKAAELDDDHSLHWLCDDCIEQSCLDI